MVNFIPVSGAARPFSAAVQAGNTLYISGQVGIDRSRGVYPDSVDGQTRQAVENLCQALESQGWSLSDVVKLTVILTSADAIAAFNAAYESVFPTPLPARTLMVVSALAGPAMVELDAIAYREP